MIFLSWPMYSKYKCSENIKWFRYNGNVIYNHLIAKLLNIMNGILSRIINLSPCLHCPWRAFGNRHDRLSTYILYLGNDAQISSTIILRFLNKFFEKTEGIGYRVRKFASMRKPG